MPDNKFLLGSEMRSFTFMSAVSLSLSLSLPPHIGLFPLIDSLFDVFLHIEFNESWVYLLLFLSW